MERKAARWFGLASVGAIAVAWWRCRRTGPDSDQNLDAAPSPVPTASERTPASDPSPNVPSLVSVPDLPAAGPRWKDPIDGTCPDGYPVKVNQRSGIYHVPGGLSYERTQPSRCYADPAEAESDGYRRARR